MCFSLSNLYICIKIFSMMKLVFFLSIISCCIYGCKDKELPGKYLSTVAVVREADKTTAISGSLSNVRTESSNPLVPKPDQITPSGQTRYHIIVASFSNNEKARAEKLVEKLKAENYPATLLSSSQRYRVSIESFPSEQEANTARDEYRAITDRQDIWVHRVN